MKHPEDRYSQGIYKLFKDGRIKVYPKNQLIHYQGDMITSVYLVKKGFIKAYTILDSGDTRTILILSKGDLLPLAFSPGVDTGENRTMYFYQSLTDVEIQAVPTGTLRKQIKGDSEMMKAYIDYLEAAHEVIMNQLEAMKNKKAIDKVVLMLPYLVNKAGYRIRRGLFRLQFRLSHQELADLSGVTRETVTTLIKELQKDGVIDQHRGKWLINTDRLDKLSGR